MIPGPLGAYGFFGWASPEMTENPVRGSVLEIANGSKGTKLAIKMSRLLPLAILTTGLSAWGQGSIVATSVDVLFSGLWPGRSQRVTAGPFDIRGEGFATFTIGGSHSGLYGYDGGPANVDDYVGINAVTPIEVLKTPGARTANLQRGDVVGPVIPNQFFWGNVDDSWGGVSYRSTRFGSPLAKTAWKGSLGLNGEVFIAFRLPTPAGFQYGWIGIASDGSDPVSFTPKLVGWAYQSQPGLSITAGAVPEPGILGLGVIGAAALICFRKRRAKVP